MTSINTELYESLAERISQQTARFMNYGYQGKEVLPLLSADGPYQFQAQMYSAVTRDLHGKDVLEVGCGRGGGCDFMCRYMSPGSLTGVDLSPNNIEQCKQHYTAGNLSFRVGDAENLPFEDNTFDAVVNIESSHCYGSRAVFFKQVRRVLRNDGLFMFADFWLKDETENIKVMLQDAGLTIIEQEDITQQVYRSLCMDVKRKTAIIGVESQTAEDALFLFDFCAMPGSNLFIQFSSGTVSYYRFKCGVESP